MSLKKLGRYDLVRVLGKGAMGIVYEGRDPNLDRRVAIKTVKVENLSEEAAAEYEARFRTEARSAARLQHPNIVSVYDSDRDGDIAFLVMEFIQGDDLKHHIDKGVRYSLEQSLKMIRDLLSALDYAHKQGIVHRDIKPANLLIEPGGRVKLTDFGVARIQDSGEATRTQGSMVGTLKYMSPEQVQGQKIDSRADLFSVGVVLYQLLTDKRPFDGDNDFSIIHQIIGHTPAAPTSFNARLPDAIDAVVARALAKDREQRFASARDFATALQSAIRKAEDSTIVPPADPLRKADAAGTGSKAGSRAGTASGTSGTSASSLTSATSASQATVTQELELVYWKDIKDSSDPEELEGFLSKFPEGIYADLARRRLRKLANGTSGDPSMVGGAAVADQDMEATRMLGAMPQPTSVPPVPPVPIEPTPLPVALAADAPPPGSAAAGIVVAAAPETAAELPPPPPAAPAGTDFTGTVIEPRAQAEAPEPASPAAPAKKPPVAVLAGGGAVLVAALAAFMLMGKGGDKPGEAAASPQPAASQPAPATPLAVASGAVVTPGVAAASASVAAASAPRKPASAAPRPKRAEVPASAPIYVAPVAPPPAPVRIAAPEPARAPTSAPVAVATPPRGMEPAETCKDKVFLSKALCMQEECAKPAWQTYPACVKLKEEARMREDSRRNSPGG